MLTPSVFHFSMKLSSCAWAAVVSVPVMVRIAVDPVFALAFFSAGTVTLFTALGIVLVAEDGDRLALEPAGRREQVHQLLRDAPPWWRRA